MNFFNEAYEEFKVGKIANGYSRRSIGRNNNSPTRILSKTDSMSNQLLSSAGLSKTNRNAGLNRIETGAHGQGSRRCKPQYPDFAAFIVSINTKVSNRKIVLQNAFVSEKNAYYNSLILKRRNACKLSCG